jgi:hypothetical protein
MLTGLAMPSFAVEQGGVTAAQAAQTNDEIIAEILADSSVSNAAKAQVQQKAAFVAAFQSNPAAAISALTSATTITARPTTQDTSSLIGSGTAVLQLCPAVTYALNVTPYRQETSSWCSAATVKQTLMYIKGSSPTQTAIMAALGAGPGLDKVLTYLNTQQTANNYFRTNCASQAEFDDRLAYCATNYTPMIFTLKRTAATVTMWPYPTDGHFTNCDGNFGSNYLFSDPYYFIYYLPNLTIPEPGYLTRSFAQLSAVNKALMGTTYMQVGY